MTGTVCKRTYRSGKTVWCYSIDLGEDENGNRRRLFKSGFRTRTEADQERIEKLREFQEGDVVAPAPQTLAAFMDEWLREHASRNCAPKTVERYRELAAYALPHVGAVPLSDVTTLMLERLYNKLRDSGGRHRKTKQPRPLSAKTVRNVAGVISSALETAVRWKLIRDNAARRCVLPRVMKTERPVLEKDRLEWFLDAARAAGIYAPLMIDAATGIRRGELLALTWSDFNEITGLMVVSKSLEQTKAGLRIKPPKNGKTRAFQLPAIAVEALCAHREQQRVYREQFGKDYRTDLDLIFATAEGEYLKPDSFSAKVSLLADKAGLQDVSLHTLRHSHGSQLLSLGVPMPTVSKRLGHSSTYVTAQIYSHALAADEILAAEKWDAAMRPTSEGPAVKH